MRFYSKAKTLIELKKNYQNLNIPETLLFTVFEYKKNSDNVIAKIKQKFKNKKIAIRSSSATEDSPHQSMAGKFKSFLNIDSKNTTDLKNKISAVIKSYGRINNKDQFFIQNMVNKIKISGVITTRDKNTNSPYIKIEYSKSSKSDQITSGTNIVKSFTYFKLNKKKLENKIFQKCDKLTKILEKIFNHPLDIEFAISKNNKIHLLQVRPLVIIKKRNMPNEYFQDNLKKIEKKISKLQKRHYNLYGHKAVYGVMPDWNPAEMIGIKPKNLSLSLYEELITNDVWSKQRKSLGYKDLTSHHLLINILGTPYVDVRVDFNSWIPANLNDKTSEKLVNFYINKFSQNLFLHDKIEFNIIFTCSTLDLNEKVKELKTYKFSNIQIKKLIEGLRIVTNNTINNFNKTKKNLEILQIKNKQINDSSLYIIDKIYWLLEDCKKYGTFTFAGAARSGFIAIEILESMVRNKIINITEKNKFLNSIETISSTISKDYIKLEKLEFIKKHGHVRPNMYDINSKNYKEGFSQYFSKKSQNQKIKPKQKFNFTNKQLKLLNRKLKLNNFKINAYQLIDFIKNAIKYREYSKYVFSKNVSDILEYIKILFKKNNINPKLAEFVNIQTIKRLYYNLSSETVKKNLENEIKKNQTEYKKNQLFKLPDNIINPGDTYQFHNQNVKSNFVTNKKTAGQIYKFELSTLKKMGNKIVFIENADPGYDFIFTKKIKGLVTKYGGANSHMAIRCAELGIPAAIGVGDKNYSEYLKANILQLNCDTNLIKVLSL
jgi:phosphohistidine swiveling domain-containing protein